MNEPTGIDLVLDEVAPQIVRYAIERVAKDWSVPPHLVGFLAGSLPSFLRATREALRREPPHIAPADELFSSFDKQRPRTKEELVAASVAVGHLYEGIERALDEQNRLVRFSDARRVSDVLTSMREVLERSAATR